MFSCCRCGANSKTKNTKKDNDDSGNDERDENKVSKVESAANDDNKCHNDYIRIRLKDDPPEGMLTEIKEEQKPIDEMLNGIDENAQKNHGIKINTS